MSAELEIPPRPYVPPSAAGAIGALVASALLLDRGWGAYMDGGAQPVELAVAVAAVAGASLAVTLIVRRSAAAPGVGPRRARALTWAAWCLAGIAAASISCALWMRAMDRSERALSHVSASALTFVTRGDPSVNTFGAASSAVAAAADGEPVGSVRLNLNEPVEGFSAIRCVGRLERLAADDWGRSRFMRGEVASVDAVKVLELREGADAGLIWRFRAGLLGVIDPAASPARALIAGVVCGRTTELSQTDASDDFSRTGLSHLVAVSGSHLALIAALLQGALVRMGAGRLPRSALLAAVMAAYVVFTGGAPSAVRSLLMVLATMASGSAGRRGHAVSGLSLTVIALVIRDPGVAYDLGFQLSAASVLFIALFGRYIAYLLCRLRLARGLAEALSMTLAAQWATLPLTVPVFGQASLISPLANLAVGPLMSLLLLLGLVLSPVCLAAPALVPLMALPVGAANASIWAAGLLAAVPYASLAIEAPPLALLAAYAAAAAFYLLWRDWSPRVLAIASLAVLLASGGWWARWRLFAPAELVVLDVGQADAILIRDGASAVLVDAGVDDAVVSALARNRVLHLDAVVITHWDRDHWGGLPDILDSIPVDRLVAAEGAAEGAPGEVRDAWNGEIDEMAHGDVLRAGAFSYRAVWPREPVEGSENGDSLCLATSYESGGRSMSALLTGDTELDQERVYAEEVGDVDILKVGHHGSKVSLDADLLKDLDPEVAVASAGEGNSYGHPSQECVEAVGAHGSVFRCTKDDGDVRLTPDRDGVRLESG